MAYILTKERAEFIRENLLYKLDYIEEGQSSVARTLFETMTNSWEIHYFVSQFNWDCDLTVLTWIIDSSFCDKATALMMFWHSSPNFYTQFATEAEAAIMYESFVYRMIQKIMSNWESGFYINQRIAYNPSIDVNWEFNYRNPNEKWAIPDYMKEPILGEELVVEK